MRVAIKPLSVNQCWQGRRFKTQKYKAYEKELLALLPKITIPGGPLELNILVGFSSKASDIDNMAKPFIDVLQKCYDFDDRRIYKLVLIKTIVKKGQEYIEFKIDSILC